ncbi:MAG: IclR family transcriptional regulator [Planctomycetota bacterium]|jgi:IclR family acetate operon transcriptional repressor
MARHIGQFRGFGDIMGKRGRKRTKAASHGTSFLKSVVRTLDALELLSQRRSIGVTGLADSLKIANSTAHRILTTLEKKGFAVQDPETGKYALGHMVFHLAKSVIHMVEPIEYVRPYLEELHSKIGENIAFGIVSPAKNRTVVLLEKMANKAVVAKSILFEHFPIHVCACGKAYLLTLNDQELKAVLSRNVLTRFTKYTPVSLTTLKKQLKQFRSLGYALNRDEFSIGLSAMGSGISNAEDKFAGAIIVVGPSFRFTDENIRRWAKLLLRATAKLSLQFKTKGIV